MSDVSAPLDLGKQKLLRRPTLARPMRLLMLSVLSLLTVSAPAQAQKMGRAETEAIAASPAEVAEKVSVDGGGSLATKYTLSTRDFLRSDREHDQFVRAIVDIKTGRASYHVYFWTAYKGEAKHFDTVTFETPDGPVRGDLNNLEIKVTGCSSWTCYYREDVAFDVPEKVLQAAAAGAKAGNADSWKYQIAGRFGDEPPQSLLKTEIAGLLLAVRNLRADHPEIPNPERDAAKGPQPVTSIADEIAKLAALRDKKIITASEFETQKAALLKR